MTMNARHPGKSRLFIWGVVHALLGAALARLAPPGYFGLLAVFLAALGLLEVLKVLFARHRDVAWSGGDVPAASRALAADLLAVQAGAVLGFAIVAAILRLDDLVVLFRLQLRLGLPVRVGPEGASAAFAFQRTLVVGLAAAGLSALLAALYKEGGLALVIAWIGSVWGLAASLVAGSLGAGLTAAGGISLGAALVAGSLGHAAAGMAGLFLGRGAQRCGVRSAEFRPIARTSLLLLVTAVIAEAVAAAAAAGV
jgi:hypothetical protein